MKRVINQCDIRGCTNIVDPNEVGKKKEVIFITNQNDGKHASPYFDCVTMDLCPSCKNTALSGRAIQAEGAMGHNNYWFKKEKGV